MQPNQPHRSPKRDILCSRDHAQRVASQIFDREYRPVGIVRTGNPIQPFRVAVSPKADDDVEVLMVA